MSPNAMSIFETEPFFRDGETTPAVYSDPDGESSSINVQFDRDFDASDSQDSSVANYDTIVLCQSVDIPKVSVKAKMTIKGVAYKIKEIEVDAIGTTRLSLTVD